MKNQGHKLGCAPLRLLEELLHLRWRTSIRGAKFLPVYFLTMRLGESKHPFDTSFHRCKLHRKNRVFDGVEGFDELSEIAGR
jgi:hypothetical protein